MDRANVPNLDLSDIAAFCATLSRGSRDIALRYFRQRVAFERKEDLTPVTIADRAIEEYMRACIGEKFPDHGIVGEEMGETIGARYTWYLDPIDGTKSFITGMPLFGSLVALRDERSGRQIYGMVSMPALNECWTGDGTSAFMNGQPARVSDCTELAASQIYTSSPDFFQPDEWAIYDKLSRKAAYRRFGGDCYLYGLLASGYCDLVVEVSLKTFDFMALIPVIEGAGGVIRDWEGRELTPQSDGRVVAAANDSLLRQALDVMHS